MSEIKYHVYMQEVDKDGNPLEESPRDIEKSFIGLKYSRCKGFNDIGKPKNVYTEKYAESEKTRVFLPKKVANDATKVTLTIFFLGADRQSVYDQFNAYISKGFHTFWDDVRKKVMFFYFESGVKLSDDKFIGSEPYIEVAYTLNNVYGKTFDLGTEPWKK